MSNIDSIQVVCNYTIAIGANLSTDGSLVLETQDDNITVIKTKFGYEEFHLPLTTVRHSAMTNFLSKIKKHLDNVLPLISKNTTSDSAITIISNIKQELDIQLDNYKDYDLSSDDFEINIKIKQGHVVLLIQIN